MRKPDHTARGGFDVGVLSRTWQVEVGMYSVVASGGFGRCGCGGIGVSWMGFEASFLGCSFIQ